MAQPGPQHCKHEQKIRGEYLSGPMQPSRSCNKTIKPGGKLSWSWLPISGVRGHSGTSGDAVDSVTCLPGPAPIATVPVRSRSTRNRERRSLDLSLRALLSCLETLHYSVSATRVPVRSAKTSPPNYHILSLNELRTATRYSIAAYQSLLILRLPCQTEPANTTMRAQVDCASSRALCAGRPPPRRSGGGFATAFECRLFG